MWGSRSLADGIAGSAKPPALLSSAILGLSVLFLPREAGRPRWTRSHFESGLQQSTTDVFCENIEDLADTTADGISISSLCEKSEDAPSGNDVSYHLVPSSISKQSNQQRTRFSSRTSSERFLSRWKSSWTSTCDPTTVMKTGQTVSTTTNPKQERPRSRSTPSTRCSFILNLVYNFALYRFIKHCIEGHIRISQKRMLTIAAFAFAATRVLILCDV